MFKRRKQHIREKYNTDRFSSVENLANKSNKYNKTPIYNEEDVKDLKIVDYFNGLNRLNRYIKKTKERLKSATRGIFKSENIGSHIVSPFKRTLLNVNEIYQFVEDHQNKASIFDDSKQNENTEIIVRQNDTTNTGLNEKEKWSKIMSYLRQNPKILVDALPDPESFNQTMQLPISAALHQNAKNSTPLAPQTFVESSIKIMPRGHKSSTHCRKNQLVLTKLKPSI